MKTDEQQKVDFSYTLRPTFLLPSIFIFFLSFSFLREDFIQLNIRWDGFIAFKASSLLCSNQEWWRQKNQLDKIKNQSTKEGERNGEQLKRRKVNFYEIFFSQVPWPRFHTFSLFPSVLSCDSDLHITWHALFPELHRSMDFTTDPFEIGEQVLITRYHSRWICCKWFLIKLQAALTRYWNRQKNLIKKIKPGKQLWKCKKSH